MREIAKRMLVSVGIAMANAENLMDSENEGVKVFALDAFTTLAEIELALLTALGIKAQSEERNPLARRLRLERWKREYKPLVIPIFRRCSRCAGTSSRTASESRPRRRLRIYRLLVIAVFRGVLCEPVSSRRGSGGC